MPITIFPRRCFTAGSPRCACLAGHYWLATALGGIRCVLCLAGLQLRVEEIKRGLDGILIHGGSKMSGPVHDVYFILHT